MVTAIPEECKPSIVEAQHPTRQSEILAVLHEGLGFVCTDAISTLQTVWCQDRETGFRVRRG